MSSPASNVNLSIVLRNATPEMNAKATAIELLERASRLEEAIRTLRHEYTYEITASDPKKIAARRQLGGMSAEVLETMRDELISAGTKAWREYETLRNGEGSTEGTPVLSEASQG